MLPTYTHITTLAFIILIILIMINPFHERDFDNSFADLLCNKSIYCVNA